MMGSSQAMNAAAVTAVVVTHNRPEELRMVVTALLGQTLKLGQILVIDNASPLPAAEVLGGMDGVQVIRSEVNTGGAGGFAFALAKALETDGQWVWMMDDDAVPRPDALQALLRAAEKLPPQVGALCNAVYEFDKLALTHRRNFGFKLGLETPLPASAYAGSTPQAIDMGSFVGFMVKAEAARQVGLPDAEFFIAYDDTEYSLRLRQAGWTVWLVPDSGIDHLRTLQSRLSTSEFGFKHYYNIRNRLVVVRRYAQHKTFAGVLAVAFGTLIWLVSRRSMRVQAWAQFRQAVRDGWCGRLGKVS